jgi:hypothetical protein
VASTASSAAAARTSSPAPAGGDLHEGQGGKEEINSRGDSNTDTDNYGTEADVPIADAFDTVNPDCESVLP